MPPFRRRDVLKSVLAWPILGRLWPTGLVAAQAPATAQVAAIPAAEAYSKAFAWYDALKEAATAPSAPLVEVSPAPTDQGDAPDRASAPAEMRSLRELPAATVSGTPPPAVAPGSKLRIALAAVGVERFSFDGESLDRGALEVTLEKLAQSYRLDTLVLLETEQPIQALHLVELSRLSAHFKIPALYQRGQTLLAVRAAPN